MLEVPITDFLKVAFPKASSAMREIERIKMGFNDGERNPFQIAAVAFNACALCSYAALFGAARAALAYEGFDRPTWGHSELRSRFTDEFIKNRHRYPPNFGTWLSDAFVLRNSAQYGLSSPKTKRVRRMLNHAKEFIQKVKEGIEP